MALMMFCGLVLVCFGLVKEVLPATWIGVLDLYMAAGLLHAYLRAPTVLKSN